MAGLTDWRRSSAPPLQIVRTLESVIGEIREPNLAYSAAGDDILDDFDGLLKAPILGDGPKRRPFELGIKPHQLNAARHSRRTRFLADHVLPGREKKFDRAGHDVDGQRQVYEIDIRVSRDFFKRPVGLDVFATVQMAGARDPTSLIRPSPSRRLRAGI
jgi:hypothetical protein